VEIHLNNPTPHMPAYLEQGELEHLPFYLMEVKE
jgi:hypothetical protein